MGKAKSSNKPRPASGEEDLPTHIDPAEWMHFQPLKGLDAPAAIVCGSKVTGNPLSAGRMLFWCWRSGRVQMIYVHTSRAGEVEIGRLPDDIELTPNSPTTFNANSTQWEERLRTHGGEFAIHVNIRDMQRELGWPVDPQSIPALGKSNPRGAGRKPDTEKREFLLIEAAVYVMVNNLPDTLEQLYGNLVETLPEHKMLERTQALKVLRPFFERMEDALRPSPIN